MRYLALCGLLLVSCSVAGAREAADSARAAAAQRLPPPSANDAILLQRKEAELQQRRDEIAALRTRLGQVAPEIMVVVKLVEVQRGMLRGDGVDVGKNSLLEPIQVSGTPIRGDRYCIRRLEAQHPFFKQLDAWTADAQELAKVLAHNSLTSVLGQPAFVHLGGEFPVPIDAGLGTVGIEFRRYGTQLDFYPEILGDGKYHLEVRPRICELDESTSVTFGDVHIPGTSVTECDLSLDMTAQQVVAVGGMMRNRVRSTGRKIAGIQLGRDVNEEIEILVLISLQLAPYSAAAGALEVPGMASRSDTQRLPQTTADDADTLEPRVLELKLLSEEIAVLRSRLGRVSPPVTVAEKIFEIDRTALKRAGVDVGERSVLEQVKVQGKAAPGDRFCIRKLDAQHPMLKQLETWAADPQKPARVSLAEVHAIPLGQPDYVNIGGEVPVLMNQGGGTIGVEYRRYGTTYEFVPEALGNGKYLVRARPRFNDVDPKLSILLGSAQVPGFIGEECDLALEISADQVVAVGGMVKRHETAPRLKVGSIRLGKSTVEEIETVMLFSLKVVPDNSAAIVPKN